MEQLPAPEVSDPLQDSPVLAVTETVPVGEVTPVTEKLMVTTWAAFEGFGAAVVMVVALGAFCAATVRVACAGA
jgi:hypothetical protein